jgi:hypothetical protein
MKVIGEPESLEASLLSQLGLVDQFVRSVYLAGEEVTKRVLWFIRQRPYSLRLIGSGRRRPAHVAGHACPEIR